MNKLKEVFSDIVMYEGYEYIIVKWIDMLEEGISKKDTVNLWDAIDECEDEQDVGSLNVLQMILVLLFGDYGTSPRYGWVTDTEKCKDFLFSLECLHNKNR